MHVRMCTSCVLEEAEKKMLDLLELELDSCQLPGGGWQLNLDPLQKSKCSKLLQPCIEFLRQKNYLVWSLPYSHLVIGS